MYLHVEYFAIFLLAEVLPVAEFVLEDQME